MLDKNDEADLKRLEELHSFNRLNTGQTSTWAAVLRYGSYGKGDLKIVKMIRRPCYGEMRAYGKNSTRPEDPKPSDLPHPLPPRNKKMPNGPFREAFALPLVFSKPYFEFITGETSPWRSLFKNGVEVTDIEKSNGQEKVKGFVLTETDVDPTLLVAFCMNHRSGQENAWNEFRADKSLKDRSDLEIYVVSKFLSRSNTYSFGDTYSFSPNPSLRLLKTGTFNDLSNSSTWREGEDYNRPLLPELFSDRDKVNFIKDWHKFFAENSKGSQIDRKVAVEFICNALAEA